MSAAALLALVKKLPGIVYVIAFVVASIAAGAYAMYRTGVGAGERHEQRTHLAAELPTAKAAVHAAEARSDAAVKEAGRVRASNDALIARRAAVRQAALPELLDAGLPKIHALIALDDSIATGAAHVSHVDAGAFAVVLDERAPHEHLETVQDSTILIGAPEPDHHTVLKIAGGAVAGVLAVLTLLHFAR